MPRIKICKEEGCHNAQTTSGYCRLHYLKYWKKIKADVQERSAKRLNNYIEAICRKNPKKYVEVIKDEINQDRIGKVETGHRDVDDLYHIFNEATYEEDINRLIQDLKIEKDF